MSRPMEPATRDLGSGLASRRRTIDLILRYLERSQQDTGHPRPVESLGRKQQLHRQPWRRPRRPGVEGISTMELIRRYEARLRAH